MAEENKVEFKIRLDHAKPVELKTMAVSLLSFEALINSHTAKEHGISNSKVFLDKVEVGSDIYSLIFEISNDVLLLIAPLKALNGVIELITSFKTLKDKSIKEVEQNSHLTPENANLLKNIFAPVVINNNTYNISHGGKVLFHIDAKEAQQIMENADYVAKKEPTKYQDKHENALIKMHQTTNKATDIKVKHKAKCDELALYYVPIVFENEAIAKEVLSNPYGFYFLMDLEYYKDENGKVTLYRAYNLKTKIEIDKE